ncbi:pyridoxal phosphate-dependent aminotransferase [Sesbania bispinosa]|nr:pyridoxal phosphate-dependent aminotransferase [Sesbania bispinosa]
MTLKHFFTGKRRRESRGSEKDTKKKERKEEIGKEVLPKAKPTFEARNREEFSAYAYFGAFEGGGSKERTKEMLPKG